jgi:hypothetical protein
MYWIGTPVIRHAIQTSFSTFVLNACLFGSVARGLTRQIRGHCFEILSPEIVSQLSLSRQLLRKGYIFRTVRSEVGNTQVLSGSTDLTPGMCIFHTVAGLESQAQAEFFAFPFCGWPQVLSGGWTCLTPGAAYFLIAADCAFVSIQAATYQEPTQLSIQ